MDTYQYKYGDRPLEGYTIQRAAGRGGFGEVYYAISDSGRQVALKAVQSYEQIELRGISQCMNLKSPHLVTIFDVKYNDKGRPFVIMEYVSGPSLADLLKESPGGLGTQKAAFFLREIGKGLSHLHECGIVHRDLKPGNIFYENGYVKIGDYGLTKAISASHHVSHTITVGTVHYMAPEIGAGKYDRSVDIYALGVLLYEMLTGQVPFLGASPAEILMKHMTAAPDLTNIEEPFARVIRRALAKDPAERYQTVQEMVEDVFGAEHVRNSVSQFSAEELSVVAEHVAQKVRGAPRPPYAQAVPPDAGAKDFSKEIGKKAEQFARKAEQFAKKAEVIGDRWQEKFKTAKERARHVATQTQVADPLSRGQRNRLAMIATAGAALGAGVLTGGDNVMTFKVAPAVFVMITVASRIILHARFHWWPGLDNDTKGWAKVGTCFLAALAAFLVGALFGGVFDVKSMTEGSFLIGRPFRWIPGVRGPTSFLGGLAPVLASALPLLLVDWWKATDPQRVRRVTLGDAIWVGVLGLVAAGIFNRDPVINACTLAGIVLVVQTLSPFGQVVMNGQAAGGSVEGTAQVAGAPVRTSEGAPYGVATNGFQGGSGRSAVLRPVPRYARPLWMIGWLMSVGFGLMAVIMAGVGNMHGEEFGVTVAVGVDLFIFSVLCFIMMCRTTFAGWYRYLVRPLLLTLCVQVTVAASISMGTMNLHNEEMAMALFFIIFPMILFLVVLLVPARLLGTPGVSGLRRPSAQPRVTPSGSVTSPANRTTALLLAVIGPALGVCGLQRFYVGKIGTGILWLFTWGLCGIGQIIDIILIASGQFRDRNGLPVTVWNSEQRNQPAHVWKPATAAASPAEVEAAKAVQAEETPQAPPQPQVPLAAPQPPSWPSYSATTSVYQPWDPIGGLVAAVGHILAFAAILIGVGVGLHLPAMAAAWPEAEPIRNLEQALGSTWPAVVEQVGVMLTVVLLFLAAILIMIGRRKAGPMHLIRSLIALTGLFFATLLFRSEALSAAQIESVVEQFKLNQVGPGLEILFRALSHEEIVIAGIMMLVSVLVLSWPPRRRMPVMMPMPNQGVVL